MRGKRVLVVEDEIAVGLDIHSTLADAGFDVVGPVTTLEEALKTVRSGIFHAAILDANLNGRNVSPVAEVLIEQRVPFLVVSGYAREHLPLALVHAPLLAKPYHADQLLAIVQRLCAQSVGAETAGA